MSRRTCWLVTLTAVIWGTSIAAVLAEGGCWICCKCRRECEACETPRHICEEICETKQITKIVYRTKEVPYCRHRCPCGSCKEGCSSCDPCAYYKCVLQKKSIKCGEEKVRKCVIRDVCAQCAPDVLEPQPKMPLPRVEEQVLPKSKPVEAKSASAQPPEEEAAVPGPVTEEKK